MNFIQMLKSKKTPLPKPSPKEAVEGLKIIYETIKENHRITEEQKTKREEIQALKEVELEKIRIQRDILKEYFQSVFTERKENFDKFFDVLDKGIENNNLKLMQMSLGAIIEIAKDSPLKQLEQLRDDFHNDNVKEIEI